MKTAQRVKEAFERWAKRMRYPTEGGVGMQLSVAYAAGWFAATRFHKAREREEVGKQRVFRSGYDLGYLGEPGEQ